MIDVSHLIIHDSASPFGDVFLINQWHKERGFRWKNPRTGLIINAGYHYLIYNGRLHGSHEYNLAYDGLVVPCRPEGEIGAHCAAKRMNHKSIGICLIGDGKFTDLQKESLFDLVCVLLEKYDMPIENVLGHSEVDSMKLDPRISMSKLREELRAFI